jgi:uncharacterized protein
MSLERSIIWRRLDLPGHEFAHFSSVGEKYFLEGSAIFVYEADCCQLNYQIECRNNWETSRVKVSGYLGNENIEIEIFADSNKRWSLNGKQVATVDGCTDIDLNFSPVTNSLPIRRLEMKIGEKAKVRAAWLRFPSFELEPLEQIYERISENSFLYESAGGAFRAEIETDNFGLAIKYGDFWTMEK